jgi:hypothetical protein
MNPRSPFGRIEQRSEIQARTRLIRGTAARPAVGAVGHDTVPGRALRKAHRRPTVCTSIIVLLMMVVCGALRAEGATTLAVTAISYVPTNPTQNDTVVVTATLTNAGTQELQPSPITDAWITVYCVGQLPCPGNKGSFRVGHTGYPVPDNPWLLPGESLALKFNAGRFKPGTYTLVVGVGPSMWTFDQKATSEVTLTIPALKLQDLRKQPIAAGPVHAPASGTGSHLAPITPLAPAENTGSGTQIRSAAPAAAGLRPPATPMEPATVLKKQGLGGHPRPPSPTVHAQPVPSATPHGAPQGPTATPAPKVHVPIGGVKAPVKAVTPVPPAQARKIPTPTATPTHVAPRRRP